MSDTHQLAAKDVLSWINIDKQDFQYTNTACAHR